MNLPHIQEALEKIKKYCAYQERCHQEVREKLYSFKLHRDEIDEIIVTLISEGYLNEERFARTFAGGKFRLKRWGRVKIVHELEQRGLNKNCVRAGLSEIEETDYLKSLEYLIREKAPLVDEQNIFVKRDKISRYLINKGYEAELVWQRLKALLPDK